MHHPRCSVALVGIAVAVLALAANDARAQAASPRERSFEVGLYLWGESVAGKIDTDKGEASMHISFSDILENLNVAAMLRARAQLDKFSIVFDGEYAQLESDRESRTVRIGPRGNIEIPADAKAELDMWVLELNGGYELFEARSPFARSASSPMHARGEVYAGARYYAMKPEIDINIGQFHDSAGDWQRWLDGVVGLRFGIDLSKTVVLGIQGDVGGFDIGNSSEFSWSQITSLGWAFSENMNLYLGYKFLDFKREFGDSKLDMQLRGPFLATSIRF